MYEPLRPLLIKRGVCPSLDYDGPRALIWPFPVSCWVGSPRVNSLRQPNQLSAKFVKEEQVRGSI